MLHGIPVEVPIHRSCSDLEEPAKATKNEIKQKHINICCKTTVEMRCQSTALETNRYNYCHYQESVVKFDYTIIDYSVKSFRLIVVSVRNYSIPNTSRHQLGNGTHHTHSTYLHKSSSHPQNCIQRNLSGRHTRYKWRPCPGIYALL